MQRLRVRFKRRPEVKFISHLDIIRLWHRALRRANIALAYSEGFNPHPRISLAAPLALGVTSEAELMDIWLAKYISPHSFTTCVNQQLPPGMEILQVYQIALTLPSLQSQVHYAEYRVEVIVKEGEKDLKAMLAYLLAQEHLPWQHQRDTGPKSYDLRALIDDLWLDSWHGDCGVIGMRLRCDSRGSGRPEQVIKALGLTEPSSIHRTKLILKTS
jgi:radical SAM-linked protein